ncbi:MAG: hypothetical protein RRY20_02995 [Bilophila sp.]
MPEGGGHEAHGEFEISVHAGCGFRPRIPERRVRLKQIRNLGDFRAAPGRLPQLVQQLDQEQSSLKKIRVLQNAVLQNNQRFLAPPHLFEEPRQRKEHPRTGFLFQYLLIPLNFCHHQVGLPQHPACL